eukprot:gene5913-4248_t
MDERQDEREHGVTIDAAERRFETSRRRYTIVDTPGHRDFIPNMIKGATQANIALLILPASTGEYESAMKDSAQTKEHCFLLKAMGVNHIVLVVNKMDQTTPIAWDHGRYTHIVHDMTTFLTRTQYNQPVSGANPFMDNIDQHGGRITLFRGPVLPTITRSFVATIVLMPILREPILPGHLCELYLLGVEMPCKVAALLSVSLPSSTVSAAIGSDASAAAPALQMRPKLLRDGGRTATVRIDIATATFTAQDHQNLPAILMDRFVDCRALGRFALRSKGFTFAVGVVDEATPV